MRKTVLDLGSTSGVHQYKSKWSLTPQIPAVLSSSNGPGKTNNHSVYFTRILVAGCGGCL